MVSDRTQSIKEASYPLAYTIIAHESAEQLIRLLQSIYWPQNQYCISLDAKSDAAFKSAIINKLPNCLRRHENVMISHITRRITWGHISVVEALYDCLRLLNQRQSRTKWKYHINLAGSDFPLKTNRELVAIFKIFNGANDVELSPADLQRTRYSYYSDDRINDVGFGINCFN